MSVGAGHAPGGTVLRDSAVLVPLFRDATGELRLVVIHRSEQGSHGGQLGFPGGMWEPGDASFVDTALREAREEIGLPREAVEVLAELEVVETRTTGWRIHPFLGRIERPERWLLAIEEVSAVIEVRVGDLLRPEAHAEEQWHLPGWPRPHTIGFYRVGGHALWGASHRILHPLLPRIVAGEWRGLQP